MDSNDRGVLGQCHPAPIVDVTHPVRVVHRLIRAVRVHIGHHVRNVTVRTQQIGDVVAAETAVEEELARGGIKLPLGSARRHPTPRGSVPPGRRSHEQSIGSTPRLRSDRVQRRAVRHPP